MYQFSIRNLPTFLRRTNKLARYFSHSGLRGELNKTAREFYQIIDANFERGGPRGQKWAPLDPNTEVQRILEIGYYSKSHNTGKLDWTGKLRRSLTGRSSLAKKMIRYGCLELWLGSAHPFALLHHKGSTHRRGAVQALDNTLRFYKGSMTPIFAAKAEDAVITIPARPFWSRDDENYIMTKLSVRTAKKAGRIWTGG